MLKNNYKYKWHTIILWEDDQLEWTDIEDNCYESPVDCRLDAEAEVNKLSTPSYPSQHERYLELQSKFFHTMDNFFEHTLFQEYLQAIHAEDYTRWDDEMPDAFQEWQSNIDRSEMLQHFTDFIIS